MKFKTSQKLNRNYTIFFRQTTRVEIKNSATIFVAKSHTHKKTMQNLTKNLQQSNKNVLA